MRVLRSIVRVLVGLVLLATVLLLAGYAYIRSDAGLDRLAREVSLRASNDEQRIELTGLRGDVGSALTLEKLTLADRDGVWLELHKLHVVWSPRALLRSQAPLALLEAERIAVLRQPLPSNAPASDGAAPDLGALAIYLPRSLRVAELQVDEAVAGIAQRVRIAGDGDKKTYALQLATLEGVPLSLDAMLQPQQENFAAKIAFAEAPGGVVAALLKLPNDIALSLNADITADTKGDVRIQAATLNAGTLEATAQGDYAASENRADLALTVNAPDMAVVQALSGVPMNGSAQLQASAKGTLDALAVVLNATTPHLLVQDQRVEDFTLQADATLNPSAWGSDAFAASGTVRAQGNHNGTPLTLTMRGDGGDGRVQLPELAARYGAHAFDGAWNATGSMAQFDLAGGGKLTTPDGVSNFTLDGKVDTQQPHYTGDVKGDFTHQKHRFDLSATLDADAEHADIKTLSLKGPGVVVEGRASIAIAEQLADAALQVRATDLRPLGQLLGQPLAGSLEGDVTLAHRGGVQRGEVKASAQQLLLPGVQVAALKLDAKASDAKALEGIAAQLNASGIAADGVQVQALALDANGGMKAGLSLDVKGNGTHEAKPWRVALAGKAQQPAAQHYRVDLATLDAVYDNAPIRMASPVTLQHAPSASSLSPLTLQLADGTLRAEGKLAGTTASGTLVATGVALHKLPVAGLPEMVVDATLDLSGSTGNPVLAWTANASGELDGMAVTANTQGGWREGTLQTTASASAQEANAQVQASLPARLSLQPFSTNLGERTAIKGTVKGSVPLAMFNARLRPQGHRLGGLFAGDAVLAGTLGDPYFDGTFALNDGRYDHSETGICLRDMQARIAGSRQAVTLEEFTATDSAKKKFSASGALALSGTPTLRGEATFDQFKLFCGGMMNGQIDGTIAATGTTRAMMVAGKLVLGPLNIQIPGARVSSNIPEVETQWVRPGDTQTQEAEPSVIALDITLDAPRQLFVRGRGLDAEFAGALSITGTATTPKLDGKFEKRRGTFVLLDRVLALDTAAITFDGPMPPSPFLDVKASTKVNANTITVALAGNAAKPKLSLSSSPTLPQDELLALLLFGRQLERISPFEALQLAQATRTLAGLDGGGPGIVGSIRDALGLDRLEVGADADSNVSVSTGKYVTDDVYVGVVQGAKPEDREVVTEITLTPSISGKTAVDSIGNQSVGVEWKHDY